jgi:uncharacterized membrane protein (UPF0127 family)
VSNYRVLKNADSGAVVLPRAKWCTSYWDRLRGLMLRRDLPEDEGLIFVYGRESKLDTSIHMLFMFFAIATVWLDKNGKVVDKVLAKPWRPAYASRTPAQYVVEARPSLLDRVQIGDRLSFD